MDILDGDAPRFVRGSHTSAGVRARRKPPSRTPTHMVSPPAPFANWASVGPSHISDPCLDSDVAAIHERGAGQSTSSLPQQTASLDLKQDAEQGKLRHEVSVQPHGQGRLQLVEQFSRGLNSSWELLSVLQQALRTIMAGVPASIGVQVGLLDSIRNKIVVAEAIGWQARRLKGREMGWSDFGGTPPLPRLERWPPLPAVLRPSVPAGPPLVAVASRLFVSPILVNTEVAGLLGVTCGGDQQWSAEEGAFLQLMANLVAGAVGNARVRNELAEHAREAALFEEVDLSGTRHLPLMRVLRLLVKAAQQLTDSAGAAIAGLAADGRSNIRLAAWGQDVRLHNSGQRPIRTGLSSWVVEHATPVFSNDLASDARADAPWARETGTRATSVVPLFLKGMVIGWLSAYNRSRELPYSSHDVSTLTHLATHGSAAIENAALSDRYRQGPLGATMIWHLLRDRERHLTSASTMPYAERTADEEMSSLVAYLFESTEAVFAVDGDGRVIVWNDATQSLLGRCRDDVLGQPCRDVVGGLALDGKPICGKTCEPLSAARRGEAISHGDILARDAQGQPTMLNVSGLCLRSPSGVFQALVHVIRESGRKSCGTSLYQRPKTFEVEGDLSVLPARSSVGGELTRRETQVLRLLVSGAGTKAMAERLSISQATARHHIENIFFKLGVHSRLEAVAHAQRHHLFDMRS